MNYQQLHNPAARTVQRNFQPPMDALCTCGLRYGQHKVNTLQCMNPKWAGEHGSQWLERTWVRA